MGHRGLYNIMPVNKMKIRVKAHRRKGRVVRSHIRNYSSRPNDFDYNQYWADEEKKRDKEFEDMVKKIPEQQRLRQEQRKKDREKQDRIDEERHKLFERVQKVPDEKKRHALMMELFGSN